MNLTTLQETLKLLEKQVEESTDLPEDKKLAVKQLITAISINLVNPAVISSTPSTSLDTETDQTKTTPMTPDEITEYDSQLASVMKPIDDKLSALDQVIKANKQVEAKIIKDSDEAKVADLQSNLQSMQPSQPVTSMNNK